MWRQIEQKILQIKKAAGVEIIITPDDRFYINTAIAETKKNDIIKTDVSHGLKQIDKLPEKIDKNIPISVIINGEAVLVKKLNPPTKKNSLSSILPNANPNDFYYEYFQEGNFNVISIARKDTVKKIISELKNLGYKVVAISLGFSSISHILPFIDMDGGRQIETDSTILELETGNTITDFRKKEEINNNKYQPKEYLVANQYIKPANLLSFSAAAGLLANSINITNQINEDVLSEERKEYRYFKLFKASVITLLTTIFAILLVNFLAYNYYLNKNKSFESSALFTIQQDQRFKTLGKEVRRKENFLEQSGWTQNSRTSFFADRIASLTPREILLTSMQIYPTRSNSFSDAGDNLFKKDTIMVTGICEDPVELNRFMNNLKILPDFKNIVIKNYQYRSEKESGSFLMEIIAK